MAPAMLRRCGCDGDAVRSIINDTFPFPRLECAPDRRGEEQRTWAREARARLPEACTQCLHGLGHKPQRARTEGAGRPPREAAPAAVTARAPISHSVRPVCASSSRRRPCAAPFRRSRHLNRMHCRWCWRRRCRLIVVVVCVLHLQLPPSAIAGQFRAWRRQGRLPPPPIMTQPSQLYIIHHGRTARGLAPHRGERRRRRGAAAHAGRAGKV